MVLDNEDTSPNTKANRQNTNDLALENQSLAQLMQLMDMYMKNLTFRKTNGNLDSSREMMINNQIDEIMDIIERRNTTKERNSAEISNNSENSKVS